MQRRVGRGRRFWNTAHQAMFDQRRERSGLAPRSARVRRIRRAPQAPIRTAQQLIKHSLGRGRLEKSQMLFLSRFLRSIRCSHDGIAPLDHWFVVVLARIRRADSCNDQGRAAQRGNGAREDAVHGRYASRRWSNPTSTTAPPPAKHRCP